MTGLRDYQVYLTKYLEEEVKSIKNWQEVPTALTKTGAAGAGIGGAVAVCVGGAIAAPVGGIVVASAACVNGITDGVNALRD